MQNNPDYEGLTATEALIRLHNKCFFRIRSLDPNRFIGYATNTDTMPPTPIQSDYAGYNWYPAWYNTSSTSLYSKAQNTLVNNKKYTNGITEYGYGSNPFYHNDNWATTGSTGGTNTGSGGMKHPEEYATYWHMKEYVSLMSGTNATTFSSLWALFDFAFYGRNEGRYEGYNDDYTDNTLLRGHNDKGIITRNRQTKKDIFYFYKAI